ncbi:UNVERIFIED_CONTAM: hypothetical protein FKN15_062860 [Acipenser sinensis]
MLQFHLETHLAQRLRRCCNAPSRHVKRHSSWQRCGQANPSRQGDHRSASGAGHRRSSRRNHGAVRPPLWVYQHAGNLRLQDRSAEGGALEEVADHVLVDLARTLDANNFGGDCMYCESEGVLRGLETAAIYEPSCEAYSHTGSTSGYFSIDSDGSGPLGPTLVYCNMTDDKVWTMMHHNNMELTRVQGSSLEKPYSMQFNYSTSREQLQAMVSGAEHCEQEIVYRCKRSRLLNTRDGTPFSWWVGRTSERQTYWSGSLPGVQQCSCGLNENCIDMSYFCNCDADRDEWANDTGLLSYKEHLPVNRMVIGDTSRTGSEAVYRIGPLRCYGDRNFWNAASFNMETSYIHFPTFHAQLSADISFYFKTTAKSGVFLENMGIKDFIRIELSSPSAVTFSFDVGNGPIKLTVKSPTPLNDKQWHYVKAERNTKEALLQVDQLPIRFLEALPDGHFRLQLNSQLFVGGTASRQKGFLGCVRSLMLNGLTLDLEERAKMTPGVQPGCPGHCSSYGSFCHNGGKCIEKYNGFSCDCIHSAYRGPLCKKEVSLLFEAGSSVTYTFQEPLSVSSNKSSQSSAIYAEMSKSQENIAFSFLTTHTPAMLLSVTTYYHEYVAVILSKNEEVDYSREGLHDIPLKIRQAVPDPPLRTVDQSASEDAEAAPAPFPRMVVVEVKPAGILPLLVEPWAVDAWPPPSWAVDGPTPHPPVPALGHPPPTWAQDVQAPPSPAIEGVGRVLRARPHQWRSIIPHPSDRYSRSVPTSLASGTVILSPPLNPQIDQNVNTKYSLTSDTEFNAIKSLTLGKVTGSPGLDEEVRMAGAQGFIGCLSSVQFNHIAPLKAALHHHRSTVVTVKGRLVESSCGSTSMADLNTFTTTHSLSGIIAVVIFITVCVIAIMTRFLYQHRKGHQTGTEKDKEHRENLEYSLRNHTDLHDSVSESKKEYFI